MRNSDDLIDLTFEVSRCMRRYMHTLIMDKSVNWLQMHALIQLSEQEGITMTEIAQFMKVSAPTATSFVNRLVKLKWIERKSDATNRKLVRLYLTDAGKKILKEKVKQRREIMQKVVTLLSEQDQKDLARIYRNLLLALSRSHS